jgi:hypothetical protein
MGDGRQQRPLKPVQFYLVLEADGVEPTSTRKVGDAFSFHHQKPQTRRGRRFPGGFFSFSLGGLLACRTVRTSSLLRLGYRKKRSVQPHPVKG